MHLSVREETIITMRDSVNQYSMLFSNLREYEHFEPDSWKISFPSSGFLDNLNFLPTYGRIIVVFFSSSNQVGKYKTFLR